MRAEDLQVGMSVQVAAADEFFAFVDGWIGVFSGFTGGYPTIHCKRDDGIKIFYVPADQLRPVNG